MFKYLLKILFNMKKLFVVVLLLSLMTSCLVVKSNRKSCGLPKHKSHHKTHYHRF